MSVGIVWDERYAWHDAGRASNSPWAEPYPAFDRPESKRRLFALVEASGLMDHLVRIPARAASEAELGYFHTPDYIERIRALSEAGGGDAGEAAVFGPNGFDIARLAVGGCLEATSAVLSGRLDKAYALVRPCGHHAEPGRGRGFCLFGNIVIAIHHAQAVHGVKRIAVIDWDVHHGNGTQDAFYDSPDVLTISVHQDRYYPVDSGGSEEKGEGSGHGFNINVPLPPGSGHGAYVAAFERIVVPAIDQFAPELIIIACGFDAGMSDPLGRMLCYSETYREMTRQVTALASTHCDGRVLICHEGGYSPTYVPFCGLAMLEELVAHRTAVDDPLAAWYARVGGRTLQHHQESLIDAITKGVQRSR